MGRNVVDDHWRNTGNEVDAGGISAWALLPLPLLLIWKNIPTLCLILLFLGVFIYLANKGYKTYVAVRRLRIWFSGARKMVRKYW